MLSSSFSMLPFSQLPSGLLWPTVGFLADLLRNAQLQEKTVPV